MRPKVSVIIPVYNAERFIRRCAESLFRQTLLEIEYIFVDDCTPDNSIKVLKEVLEEFPERKEMVKIIRMPQNSKQAAARNEGLRNVTGEYTIHCDPDDWVDEDYYEGLFTTAKRENLDIVIGKHVNEYAGHSEQSKRKIHLPVSVSGREYIFEKNRADQTLWCHLVRTELITTNKLTFYTGINYSEDCCFVIRAYVLAERIGKWEKSVYHYNVENLDSISKCAFRRELIEQEVEGLKLVDTFMRDHSIDPYEVPSLRSRKSSVKDKYLIIKDFKAWKATFPEVADWYYSNPGVSPIYRWLYKYSQYHAIWPLKLYVLISDRIKGRTYPDSQSK